VAVTGKKYVLACVCERQREGLAPEGVTRVRASGEAAGDVDGAADDYS
jgi:hypothetical protein